MNEAAGSASQLSGCPVCGVPGLDGAALACPQCDADLRCFRALEILSPGAPPVAPALPAEVPVVRAPAAPGARVLLVTSAALFLFSGLVVALLVRQGERRAGAPCPRPVPVARTVPAAAAEAGKKDGSEAPKKETAASTPAAVARPVAPLAGYFEARSDDSLWSIAARLYGRGDCYPLLLEDNPRVRASAIGAGLKLKVVGDQQEAARRCRALFHRDGAGRFWYYTLRSGDSPEQVARRCWGSPSSAIRLRELNPRAEWRPGERIKLHLP